MKHPWKAVFFDFDGVILDSVDVKTQAFADMFRKYGPEVESAVVEYHLANGGISRFKKFEYYYKYLLQQPITQDILEDLGNAFNRLAIEGVLAAPFVDGALETLEKLKTQSVPAFVVSGTPHEEIQIIVKKRNLTPYFLEVHGSPNKKQEILQDIFSRHSLNPNVCLFVGDAITDYEAAQDSGIVFLGIVKNHARSPFPIGTTVSKKVGLNLNF